MRPTSTVPVASATDAAARLVGRWARCSGWGIAVAGGPATLADPSLNESLGVEFTADGRFYLLRQDAACALVRSTAVGDVGSFSVAPGSCSLCEGDAPLASFTVDGGGGGPLEAQVVFLDGPAKLRTFVRASEFTTNLDSEFARIP
jgi:hypothetical protein